jgi:hypothetical protein
VLVVVAAALVIFVIGTMVGHAVGSNTRTTAASEPRQELVAEHGPFTEVLIRGPVPDGATRFLGESVGFDPDVAVEHGPFTHWIIRDPVPNDTTPRFRGNDAALD